MKLRVQGGGDVTLSNREFVGSGGEGQVYVRGDTAYKIYAKADRMIPTGKIDELAGIADSRVIRPLAVLLGRGNRPVGYSMRCVRDGVPVCQMFTKAYKKRNGIGSDEVMEIISGMRSCLESIHAANVLVVDLNEMNLLVSGTEVFWIDVDSYETPHYPATAIMDSIRDWRANGKWSRETDWFSWGIVTFQLITGIHPFKGKHPSVKNLSDRMLQNLSVFNPDVAVPKMVPSFDVIPGAYRDWYRAVFEEGKRVAPPKDMVGAITVLTPRPVSSTDAISIEELLTAEGEILRYDRIGDRDFVSTAGGIAAFYNGRGSAISCPGGGLFGRAAGDKAVYGQFQRGLARFLDAATAAPHGDPVRCRGMMAYDGRFYILSDDSVMEVTIIEGFRGSTILPQKAANTMPKATQLFDGVAIQNMLGSWYASVFPASHRSHQVLLADLEGYRIVDAKHDHRVLIVVGAKGGRYSKFVYRMERDYTKAILFWKDDDIAYSGINFVTLDSGVCAHIDEAEDLVLFPRWPSQDGVKRVVDPVLGGDMRLFKRGASVVFARGSQLFKLSTRK